MLGIGTGLVAAGTSPADASANRPHVAVVKVSGLIDPINVDLLDHAVSGANSSRALVLIVQLNSGGGVVGSARAAALVRRIHASAVPVAVWVGGSGNPHAYGVAYAVARAAGYLGVGPGARLGRAPSSPSGPPDPLVGRTISADEAIAARLVNAKAPTIGDFLVGLEGVTIGGGRLHVADIVIQNGQPRRVLRRDADIAFSQLTIVPRILHGVASPNVAFVMLVVALSLALFEFFTAGIGVAAATGVLFGSLAAYGLGVLPTRAWAVALLMVAGVGFAIDVQAGAPRVWTVIGAITLLVGCTRLYAGQAVSLWVVIVMGILMVVFMVSGMPAVIRTRFSTPTIGRHSMIGTMGEAVSGVDPDGTVQINGAPWRARTNRATPIAVGDVIRVTGIDGLVLEVEPEHGGAREAGH